MTQPARSESAAAAAHEAAADLLPELAAVHWRPRADERRLDRVARLWTLWTLAHTIPFIGVAALLVALAPLTLPVALISLAHAWIIPELYAQRGANVVRRKRAGPGMNAAASGRAQDLRRDPEHAERVALGLLGDLIGHAPRELQRRTGLVLERGRLGVWLVGEAGALLVRPGGRRVHCYCVRVNVPTLPPSDRVAHLLLALRADEQGFATVANLAFVGARWRVRRRLEARMRPALEVAGAEAREPRSAAGRTGHAVPVARG